MSTKEKLEQYVEQELKDVKSLLERKPWWFNPREGKQNTITRVYGVTMFCQCFDDITYQEIEGIYNKFREDLDKLIIVD